MPLIDQLNNDLLALIAQCLSVQELLYFTRINNQLRILNTTNTNNNSSWSQQAWKYSSLSLELNNINGLFHEWIISKTDYVDPNDDNYGTETSTNSRRHRGLIPLSYWLSSKKGVCYVLRRWIYGAKKLKFSTHVFDHEFAQHIVDTRNNPATHFITLESGEQCEVLSELNEKSLYDKLTPYAFRETFPNYRPHLILTSMPYLSTLALITETPIEVNLPNREHLSKLVPHLQSLTISLLETSKSGNTNPNMRETMKCFPHLKSLTLNQLDLTIQDLIDICCQPELSFISLHGKYRNFPDHTTNYGGYNKLSEVEYNLEFDGYDLSPASLMASVEIEFDETKTIESTNKFISKNKTKAANKLVDDENEEEENDEEDDDDESEYHSDDDDGDNDENENGKFRAVNDEGTKFDNGCHEITTSRMNEDLLYINSLLTNSASSIASVSARLGLVNYLKSQFNDGKRGTRDRPLRYLWHIRHQLTIIYDSLTKSLHNNNNNIINFLDVEDQSNKKRRLI